LAGLVSNPRETLLHTINVFSDLSAIPRTQMWEEESDGQERRKTKGHRKKN
jgi:hypothetical protein